MSNEKADAVVVGGGIAGSLVADGIRAGAIEGVRLIGDVSFDARALGVSPLTLEASGNRVTLSGALPWRSGAGQGTFEAHVEDMAPFTRTLPDAWHPRGSIDASGAGGTGVERRQRLGSWNLPGWSAGDV